MIAMIGIGPAELVIVYGVFLLPLICMIPSYRLAKRKGYGQLAAVGAVAATLVLAYFNLFLAIVPLVFFALAPSRDHSNNAPVEPEAKQER